MNSNKGDDLRMKINVTGHGYIPGINQLPPVNNYDATEALVRKLVNFNDWRVYETASGRLITKTNVDSFFSSGGSPITGGVNWKVIS